MERINISEFKATRFTVFARVEQTGEPIPVTRFGKPVAQVAPPPKASPEAWLGSMRGEGAIVGDLVEPMVGPDTWEALRSDRHVSSD